MFCPKCGEIELEPVKQEKLEYLACTNSCEGVWISRADLVKFFGKKKIKTLETALVESKQPQFDDEPAAGNKPATPPPAG